MYSLESPHRADSNEYTQHTIIVKEIKESLNYRYLLPDLAPQWLELPMSRTIFYGPKDVRAIEVRLYSSSLQLVLVLFGVIDAHCVPHKRMRIGVSVLFSELSFQYSRLSLSRSPRDSLKYFEISVPRHIRFAELKKKNKIK